MYTLHLALYVAMACAATYDVATEYEVGIDYQNNESESKVMFSGSRCWIAQHMCCQVPSPMAVDEEVTNSFWMEECLTQINMF
jgi:hypothetical protein